MYNIRKYVIQILLETFCVLLRPAPTLYGLCQCFQFRTCEMRQKIPFEDVLWYSLFVAHVGARIRRRFFPPH